MTNGDKLTNNLSTMTSNEPNTASRDDSWATSASVETSSLRSTSQHSSNNDSKNGAEVKTAKEKSNSIESAIAALKANDIVLMWQLIDKVQLNAKADYIRWDNLQELIKSAIPIGNMTVVCDLISKVTKMIHAGHNGAVNFIRFSKLAAQYGQKDLVIWLIEKYEPFSACTRSDLVNDCVKAALDRGHEAISKQIAAEMAEKLSLEVSPQTPSQSAPLASLSTSNSSGNSTTTTIQQPLASLQPSTSQPQSSLPLSTHPEIDELKQKLQAGEQRLEACENEISGLKMQVKQLQDFVRKLIPRIPKPSQAGVATSQVQSNPEFTPLRQTQYQQIATVSFPSPSSISTQGAQGTTTQTTSLRTTNVPTVSSSSSSSSISTQDPSGAATEVAPQRKRKIKK